MPADKPIEPTPHRREQARREGHVAKSQDLGSAAVLLLALGILALLGSGLAGGLVDYCRRQLGGRAWLVADPEVLAAHWNATLWAIGRYWLPILGLVCLAVVAANMLQTGFMFLPERLAADFSRVGPARGLRRLFSTGNGVHAIFGLLKLAVVLGVGGAAIYGRREALLGLSALPPATLAAQAAQIIFWTSLEVVAALFLLAIGDYAYQRWRYERDLRMTPQELREELRNLEGDPRTRTRRKQVQRELALGRVPAAAPAATERDSRPNSGSP